MSLVPAVVQPRPEIKLKSPSLLEMERILQETREKRMAVTRRREEREAVQKQRQKEKEALALRRRALQEVAVELRKEVAAFPTLIKASEKEKARQRLRDLVKVQRSALIELRVSMGTARDDLLEEQQKLDNLQEQAKQHRQVIEQVKDQIELAEDPSFLRGQLEDERQDLEDTQKDLQKATQESQKLTDERDKALSDQRALELEKSQLEKEIRKLQTSASSNEASREELQTQLEEKKGALGDLDSKLLGAKMDLRHAKDDLDENQQTIQQLRDQNQELSESFQASEAKYNKVVQELKVQQDLAESSTQQVSKLEGEILIKVKQLGAQATQIQGLEQQLASEKGQTTLQKNRADRLKEARNQLKEHNEVLANGLKNSKMQVEQLHIEKDQLTLDLTTKQQEVDGLSSEKAILEVAKESLESKLKASKTVNTELTIELNNVQIKLVKKGTEIELLTNKVDDLENQKAQVEQAKALLQFQVEEQRQLYEEQLKKVDEKDKEIQTIKEDIQKIETENTNLLDKNLKQTKEIQRQAGIISKTQIELDKVTLKNTRLSGEIEQHELKEQELQATIQQNDQKIQGLQKENNDQQKDIKQLKDETEKLTVENTRITGELGRITAEKNLLLDAQQLELNQKDQIIAQRDKKIVGLKAKLTQARDNIIDLNKQVDVLQTTNQRLTQERNQAKEKERQALDRADQAESERDAVLKTMAEDDKMLADLFNTMHNLTKGMVEAARDQDFKRYEEFETLYKKATKKEMNITKSQFRLKAQLKTLKRERMHAIAVADKFKHLLVTNVREADKIVKELNKRTRTITDMTIKKLDRIIESKGATEEQKDLATFARKEQSNLVLQNDTRAIDMDWIAFKNDVKTYKKDTSKYLTSKTLPEEMALDSEFT